MLSNPALAPQSRVRDKEQDGPYDNDDDAININNVNSSKNIIKNIKNSQKPKLEVLPSLDEETRGILHSLCASLGHFDSKGDGKKYYLGLNYQEGLQDLGELILADDDGQVIFELLEMDFISHHLLPSLGCLMEIALKGDIFVKNQRNLKSFIEQISLLLDPLLLFTSSSLPVHASLSNNIASHHKRIKYLFHSGHEWINLQNIVISLSQAHSINSSLLKTFEGPIIIAKILRLTSQILLVPDVPMLQQNLNGQTSKILDQIFNCRHPEHHTTFFDILLLACSSLDDGGDDADFFLPNKESIQSLVAIFNSLLSPSNPDVIAKLSSPTGQEDRSAIRSLENETPTKKPVRHSRFSGSLVVKLSTGKDLILRDSASSFSSSSSINETLDKSKRHQYRKKKIDTKDIQMLGIGDSKTENNITLLLEDLTGGPLQSLLGKWRNTVISDFSTDHHTSKSFDPSPGLDLMSWVIRWCRKAAMLSLDNSRRRDILQRLGEIIGDHQLPLHLSKQILSLLDLKEYVYLCSIIIFEKEYLRALEAIDVVDANLSTRIQLDLFYRLDYIQSFRKALQKSSLTFSFRLNSHILEGNYCLLKQLKTFSSQHQHLFVASLENNSENNDASPPEKEFSLSNLLVEYRNESVVDSIISLIPHLNEMGESSSPISRYIAYLFSLLLSESSGKELFWKAKSLCIINSFLQQGGGGGVLWKKDHFDLLKICRWIANSFIKELSKDPSLIISSFFPTSSRNLHHHYLSASSIQSIKAKEIPSTLVNQSDKIEWVVRSLVHRELGDIVRWMLGELFAAASLRDPSLAKEHPYPLHLKGRIRNTIESDEYCLSLMELLFSTKNGREWYIPGDLDNDILFSRASMLEDSFKKVIEEESIFNGNGNGNGNGIGATINANANANVSGTASVNVSSIVNVSSSDQDHTSVTGSDQDHNSDHSSSSRNISTIVKTNTRKKRLMIMDDDDEDD